MTEPSASTAAADEAGLRRRWAWLAWLWLGVVLVLAVQQVQFWRAPRLDSDVLALLPSEAGDPLLAVANHRIIDSATGQVLVLLGSADWQHTRRAAEAYSRSIATSRVLAAPAQEAAGSQEALDFYRPYRDRLLTNAQRERLAHADLSELSAKALSDLYGPGMAGALLEWRADPLSLWPEWWQARLGQGLSLRDGLPSLSRDGREWAILRFRATTPTFKLDGQAHLGRALDAAALEARALVPDLQILRAGVPLHAEAAAVRASFEVNTIGWGSLLAVIVLMWLAFRSPLPVLLVALSLLIGCAAAVAVTVLVFGKIHLLTLVFGASLVGVAEDYGIHYFACRQGRSALTPHALMSELMPGLSLALLTSATAYLALGLAPFPGLRQMAVFSAVGLLAAFATVACWFPWLDRGARPISGFGRRIASSLAPWPRLRSSSRISWLVLVVLAPLTVLGLQRLQIHDDLRSLQNSPAELIRQQVQLGRLLGMSSPAQFYLLSADSHEAVLQKEEALKARLDKMVQAGVISGYSAVSDWLPSQARQNADAKLSAGLESAVLARASQVVGEPLSRPDFSASPLTVQQWLKAPVSEPFRSRWLGRIEGHWSTALMLEGVGPASNLALLEAQTQGLEGVRWVDRTSEISNLLAHYRSMMGWLLLAGFVAVGALLWWRYRGLAWRALLPTILATVLTLAAMGWIGEPMQLFTVLALLLLLGMGVDYGIFLVEHRDDGASWLAVSLGAGSTLLAFGLLALSATPALHSFGLTMLLGIGLVWLLSPCFRPAPADQGSEVHAD